MPFTDDEVKAMDLPDEMKEKILSDQKAATEAAAEATTKNEELTKELEAAKKPPDPDPNKDKPTLEAQVATIQLDNAKDRIATSFPDVPLDKLVSTTPETLLAEAGRLDAAIQEVKTAHEEQKKKDEAAAVLKGFSVVPSSVDARGPGVGDGGLSEAMSEANKNAPTEAAALGAMSALASKAIFSGAGLNVKSEK